MKLYNRLITLLKSSMTLEGIIISAYTLENEAKCDNDTKKETSTSTSLNSL